MGDPIPTPVQFRAYREQQRLTVKRIVACIHARVIPLGPWARETIIRARVNHSASIRRQEAVNG